MANVTEHGTTAVGAPNSAIRFITQYPEPELPRRNNYNVHTSTPWGTAQTATYFGEGLVQYSTAGHGGFHVSAGLLKRMPEYLQTRDKYTNGKAGWFEEDCAWAIVAICYPERFTQYERQEAVRTMQSYYADVWQQFCENGGLI